MPSDKHKLAYVHHRRTGRLEVRRVDDPQNSRTYYSRLPRHLHHTDKHHTNVCYRAESALHRYSSPLPSDSRHLHLRLIYYLDSMKHDSCTMAEFEAFEDKEKEQWAHLDVNVHDFHYTTKHKDCVCRCQDITHGFGKVRSPDVIDMCANFFDYYKGKLICTKAQWRAHDTKSPSYRETGTASKETLPPYQNVDVVRTDHGRVSSRSSLQSRPEGDIDRSDMPQQVWENGRPSMWSVPDERMASPTTPLGTAYSPSFSSTSLHRGGHGQSSTNSSRSSRNTTWSGIQEDAGGHMSYIAELPTNRTIVELDVTTSHRHSQTLRKLEGRYSYSDLPIPSKSDPTEESSVVEDSLYAKDIPRLSAYLEDAAPKAQEISHLPSQKEFFSSHTIIILPRKGEGRAIEASCPVCGQSLDDCDETEQPRQLFECSHYVHQECLIEGLQIRDPNIGTCPICEIALCKRNLTDLIETDCNAIFGTEIRTPLPEQERIEIPSLLEAAILVSEEGLAAAQLRLLKDYVGIHAHDIWQQWKLSNVEPTWLESVIKPATELYKGWSRRAKSCRFFVEHDSFTKLLAWAELFRLVTVIREIDQRLDRDANMPHSGNLHRNLLLGKKRYDQEKGAWEKNDDGKLECDTLADDVFKTALHTQTWLRE